MSKPNLLILTRGEQREAEVKKLLPARVREVETRFWRATLENSLNAAREAGLHTIVSSSSPIAGIITSRQEGRTFFDRLRNAETAARSDDESLIIVAADVPEISRHHLSLAAERVERLENEVVLGPTSDGGIYLIASRSPLTHLLSDVRWLSNHVAGDLDRILRAAGFEIFWLPELHDVDNTRDLHASIRRSLPALQKTFAPVLRTLRALFDRVDRTLALLEKRNFDVVDRGPPISLTHMQFQ